nr:oligosaccharide flippase family protein [Escherichia coli]
MRKYIFILFITIFAQGLSLLSNFFIANSLAINEFSKYASSLSIISMSSIVFLFGIPQYLVRNAIENDNKNLSEYFYLWLGNSSLYLIFCLFVYFGFYDNKYILYLIPFGLIVISSTYLASLYQIRNDFISMSISLISKDITKTLFALIILLTSVFSFGLWVLASSFFILYIISIYLRREWPNPSFHYKMASESFLKSLPFWISSLSYTIYYQSDVIFLTYYNFVKEVANYTLTITIMTGLLVVSSTLYQRYLLPIFYRENKKSKKLGRALINKYLIITMMLIFPFYALYYYFGEFFMALIVPDGYSDSINYMDVIIFAVIVRYLHSPIDLYMNLDIFINKKSKIQLCAAIFNVLINFIFIPIYGANVVLYSTVLTELFVLLLFLNIYIKSREPNNDRA